MNKKLIITVIGSLLLGFALAIITEPVAIRTNTCYHNSIHQAVRLKMYVSMSGSTEQFFWHEKEEIRSWYEYIAIKISSIHICEGATDK